MNVDEVRLLKRVAEALEDAHTDVRNEIEKDILTTDPTPGDIDEGRMAFGDGTGPNGRDEIFWSVDGNTIARVEADAIIS